MTYYYPTSVCGTKILNFSTNKITKGTANTVCYLDPHFTVLKAYLISRPLSFIVQIYELASTQPVEGINTRGDSKHALQDRRKRKGSEKPEKILSSYGIYQKCGWYCKHQNAGQFSFSGYSQVP